MASAGRFCPATGAIDPPLLKTLPFKGFPVPLSAFAGAGLAAALNAFKPSLIAGAGVSTGVVGLSDTLSLTFSPSVCTSSGAGAAGGECSLMHSHLPDLQPPPRLPLPTRSVPKEPCIPAAHLTSSLLRRPSQALCASCRSIRRTSLPRSRRHALGLYAQGVGRTLSG